MDWRIKIAQAIATRQNDYEFDHTGRLRDSFLATADAVLDIPGVRQALAGIGSKDAMSKALSWIVSLDGPAIKAPTHTADHWKGVVDAIKARARTALGVR